MNREEQLRSARERGAAATRMQFLGLGLRQAIAAIEQGDTPTALALLRSGAAACEANKNPN